VPGLARYISPSDLVLPAAAYLQDRRPTQRELVFMNFKRLIEDWPLIVKGATHLVDFLEQERIPDAARLHRGGSQVLRGRSLGTSTAVNPDAAVRTDTRTKLGDRPRQLDTNA
jgi:hypothetical protein